MFAEVRAESPPDPDPRPFNAVGLELSGPGLTVRRVAEKYSMLLDVGFSITGDYWKHKDERVSGSNRWSPSNIDALFRFHWLRVGKYVDFHLAAGVESVWEVFLGTGLTINKQIDDHLFIFLDSDLAYAESTSDAAHISYKVFSNERIRFGLLMGF